MKLVYQDRETGKFDIVVNGIQAPEGSKVHFELQLSGSHVETHGSIHSTPEFIAEMAKLEKPEILMVAQGNPDDAEFLVVEWRKSLPAFESDQRIGFTIKEDSGVKWRDE